MLGKAILAKVLDEARDKYTDGIIEHIQSDEFKEDLAEKINKKIDIDVKKSSISKDCR